MNLEGILVAFNMEQLGVMARGTKNLRSDLPANATLNSWNDLMKNLGIKLKDNKTLQDRGMKMGLTSATINVAATYIAKLLKLQSETVTEQEAQCRAILSSILDKSNLSKDNCTFSDQEEHLLTVLGGIGNCEPKKNEGLLTTYLLLEPKYHYQVQLPKWISAEDKLELDKKNMALDFVRDFVKDSPDKSYEAMIPLLLNLVNDDQDFFSEQTTPILSPNTLNKLIDISGIIFHLMPQESYEEEFWNVIDVKVTSESRLKTQTLNILNANGASALLSAFNREEDKRLAEMEATGFVNSMVKNFMNSKFAEDSPLIKELMGVEDNPQSVHQLLYLKNLIGHLVGVSQRPVFDPHTHTLDLNLLQKPCEKVLEVLFNHVTPNCLVNEVVNMVNNNFEQNRKILAPLLEDKFWGKDGRLTREGALTLLIQQNYFIKT
jgi:hypothetical protein